MLNDDGIIILPVWKAVVNPQAILPCSHCTTKKRIGENRENNTVIIRRAKTSDSMSGVSTASIWLNCVLQESQA
jgi:hypothetical protein